MKDKLKDKVVVEPITNFRFLNMYSLKVTHDGKTYNWAIASRRKANGLLANGGNTNPDAVAMEIIVEDDYEQSVLIIEQYRPGVNRWIVEYPAGLVEENERGNEEETAKREALEETGGVVTRIEKLSDPYLSSPGAIDEVKQVFRCFVREVGKQYLQDGEQIKVRKVGLKNIEEYMTKAKKRGLIFDSVAEIRLRALFKEYTLQKENEILKLKNAELERRLALFESNNKKR